MGGRVVVWGGTGCRWYMCLGSRWVGTEFPPRNRPTEEPTTHHHPINQTNPPHPTDQPAGLLQDGALRAGRPGPPPRRRRRACVHSCVFVGVHAWDVCVGVSSVVWPDDRPPNPHNPNTNTNNPEQSTPPAAKAAYPHFYSAAFERKNRRPMENGSDPVVVCQVGLSWEEG